MKGTRIALSACSLCALAWSQSGALQFAAPAEANFGISAGRSKTIALYNAGKGPLSWTTTVVTHAQEAA